MLLEEWVRGLGFVGVLSFGRFLSGGGGGSVLVLSWEWNDDVVLLCLLEGAVAGAPVYEGSR